MSGLLNGGIASLMDRAFAGVYLPATLYRRVRTDTDDGSVEETTEIYSCRAQLDAVTEAMRQAPGYTKNDVAIYVLTSSLSGEITTDDEITVRGALWSIASVSSDPAQSYWELRGTRR